MIYKVNENHEGAVMIGDRSYRPSQIIRDDGTNPKVTRSIEKLLKLEECPISLLAEESAPATEVPPVNPPGSNPKGKPSASRTSRAGEETSPDVSSEKGGE